MGVQTVMGGTVAWHSDIDPGAVKILAHHWPDVPNLGDMTTVDWSQVEPVDIITGGTPCQDLSHAGKRAGMRAGTRSGLWASMCDAIQIIRPSLVVWENVRGALSADADSTMEPCPGCVGDGDDGPVLRALGRVLGDLADLGYDSGWYGLRAADVGAPHGRFRIFVAATDTADLGHERGRESRNGRPGPANGSSVAPDPNGPRSQGAEPAAGRHLPDRCTHPDTVGVRWRERVGLRAEGLVAGDIAWGQYEPGELKQPVVLIPTPEASRAGGTPEMHLARKPGRTMCTNLDVLAGGVTTDWGVYGPAIERWESVFGRVAPPPTEPGRTGNPRLSPRFVEWLMGLPAGHVTDVPGLSRNEQLKALGNGVVSQQCAAALRMLLNVKEVAA